MTVGFFRSYASILTQSPARATQPSHAFDKSAYTEVIPFNVGATMSKSMMVLRPTPDKTTPAVAAGLTDHRWTVEELLKAE